MSLNRHSLRVLLPALLAVLMLASCQKEIRFAGEPAATHNLTIKFEAVADAAPLVFGDTYTNSSGEDFTVSNFNFYIAQIRLINTDSGISYNVNKDDYFLVDFADDNSTELKLKAVPATYNRIAFLVGVDSIRNVSGAQTGALDPGKGMFWTWNSGYIMAKLEGNSPASAQPNNAFEYHIGGFSGQNNVLRQPSLSFPLAQHVTLQANRSSHMTIEANVSAWFSPNNIQFSVNPVVTTPGPLAKQIADNYANMFLVTDIVTQ
jgi:hypothetical protein